jgi:hypothetical protein
MCDECNNTGVYRFDGDDMLCMFCEGEPLVRVGKYRGHKYEDVPQSYCDWVVSLDKFADRKFQKWCQKRKVSHK